MMRGGPLDVDRLREALRPPPGETPACIGTRLEHHTSLLSTNDHARALAASGAPEGTVVLAEEQTRGRGRGDRTWHSPAGLGLYLTAILRPPSPAAEAPLFGLLAAVAAAEALGRLAPAPVALHWPNDVMLQATGSGAGWRKVAGILTEARTSADSIRDLVIGIGVNVNQEGQDFPPSIAARATSLRLALGRSLDRTEVAAKILKALGSWYTLCLREGTGPVLGAYRGVALDLEGRRVRVAGSPEPWTGTTAGITQDGALRVIPDVGRPGTRGEAVAIRYGELLSVEGA